MTSMTLPGNILNVKVAPGGSCKEIFSLNRGLNNIFINFFPSGIERKRKMSDKILILGK